MDDFATSVIIPTLNEEKYLPKLLESLSRITTPLDIIVVDGKSDDNTVHVAESYLRQFQGISSLKVISVDQRNIAFQRNSGAHIAKHSTLLFLDADIVISSHDAYVALITPFKKNKLVLAAPLLHPIEPGVHIALMHAFARSTQRIMFLFGKPYFGGACLLTTKEVFVRVSGFDTNKVLAEDIDFCLRAAKHGQCGLVNIRIHVSARRFIKHGYWWLFKQGPGLYQLFVKGKVDMNTFFYPFGHF